MAHFPGVEEAPGGAVGWCLPGPSVRVSVCEPWLVLPLLVGSAPGPRVGGGYGPSVLCSGRVLGSVWAGGGSWWLSAAGAPQAYPEVDPEPRASGALTSQTCTVSSAYIWEAVLDKNKNECICLYMFVYVVFGCIQTYTIVYKRIQTYTNIYKRIHVYTFVYVCIRLYTFVYFGFERVPFERVPFERVPFRALDPWFQ